MIPLFISYARKDQIYLKELILILDDLKSDIDIWHDGFISAGEKWDSIIKSKLGAAEIVIFVLSEDFLKSQYIKKVEIARALKKRSQKLLV